MNKWNFSTEQLLRNEVTPKMARNAYKTILPKIKPLPYGTSDAPVRTPIKGGTK
jgi:hypothetical protein